MIRIEKAIKVSQSVKEISQRLEKMNTKFYVLSNIKVEPIEIFKETTDKTFINTKCFFINMTNQKQSSLCLFSLYDDDIEILQQFLINYENFLKVINESKKVDQPEQKEEKNTDNLLKLLVKHHQQSADPNRKNSFKNLTEVSEDIIIKRNISFKKNSIQQRETSHSMDSKQIQIQSDSESNVEQQSKTSETKQQADIQEGQVIDIGNGATFSGTLWNGKPMGQGTEFLNEEGISYKGEFKLGKKHGKGYVVNSNLDMLYCEYINDQPVGI